jgi:hypothetical protein
MGSLFRFADLCGMVGSPTCVSPVVCHELHPLRRSAPANAAGTRRVAQIDFMEGFGKVDGIGITMTTTV